MTNTNDVDIINEVLEGNVNLFSGLVTKYQDRIFNYCFRMLHNYEDARDASQDVFLKAYNNLSKLKSKETFISWLYSIARRHCIDLLRKPRSRFKFFSIFKNHEDTEYSTTEISELASKKFDKIDQQQQINLALKKLTPIERSIFLLFEIQGLKYNEIALVHEISVDAVRARLKRVRQKFKVENNENSKLSFKGA